MTTIDSVVTDIVTIIVCAAAILITRHAFLERKKSFSDNQPIGPFSELAPGLVVTIGIFGTFVGIYLGLRNFDTANINKSIPQLLEGLKTAFITSIVGMLCAIYLKMYYSKLEKKELERSKISSMDPIKIMVSMDANLSLINKSMDQLQDIINKVFKSDEEYSLISQVKILRTDINDLKRDIIKSLDDFGKKVAELGTEAMIKALRDVIEQFNARLNDLVGAEFKQLKEAMIKLVGWQDNYRKQVDEMQSQLNAFLAKAKMTSDILIAIEKSCKNIGESLESVDSSVSAISVSAEDIDHHVKSLSMQNKALEETMIQIKNIGEEAKKVIPSITNSINQLIDNMGKATDANMEILKKTINTNIASLNSMNEEYRKNAATNTKQIQETINQFKQDLQDALVESLKSLSGQMVAISNKFADDYTPLAEKLRDIIRIAEGLREYDKNQLQ